MTEFSNPLPPRSGMQTNRKGASTTAHPFTQDSLDQYTRTVPPISNSIVGLMMPSVTSINAERAAQLARPPFWHPVGKPTRAEARRDSKRHIFRSRNCARKLIFTNRFRNTLGYKDELWHGPDHEKSLPSH